MRLQMKAPVLNSAQIKSCKTALLSMNPCYNLLFHTAINTGLRQESIIVLKYSDFLNEDLSKKDFLLINKIRHEFVPLYIHQKLYEMVLHCYKNEQAPTSLEAFIFRNKSRNATSYKTDYLNKSSMWRMIKSIFRNAGLPKEYSTESLRATYFNHYWEIKHYTQEEIVDRYKNFFL